MPGFTSPFPSFASVSSKFPYNRNRFPKSLRNHTLSSTNTTTNVMYEDPEYSASFFLPDIFDDEEIEFYIDDRLSITESVQGKKDTKLLWWLFGITVPFRRWYRKALVGRKKTASDGTDVFDKEP